MREYTEAWMKIFSLADEIILIDINGWSFH